MLMDILFNKKIWTILMTLVLLFTLVYGLRYFGLYEGMENSSLPVTSNEQKPEKKQIATRYNF